MSFDLRMQQTALRLINKRGKTITYTAVVPGTYDRTSGSAPAIETVSSFRAIVTPGNGQDLTVGELVVRNDKNVVIAGLSLLIAPKPNDQLTVDGESFLVNAANPAYAGELVAVYKLKVRKA
ncbi:hypothetical protein [Collimonas humicola]|uniref:hypothetical protein n=1 Tax=Collimonas humicola TaxID=2825886 RepID=UPI001B8D17B3|nr:hypothetical protein [Collimonas humicola]